MGCGAETMRTAVRGFRHTTSLPEYTPEQLELFFYYCSPNVAMMRAIGIPVCIQIPAAAAVAFAVSWLLVLGIRKLAGKNAGYIVG